MLRLLARGDQGYEDIAALLGLTLDEVRARVKQALAQLEDEGLPPPALPPEPADSGPPAPRAAKAEPAPEPPAPEPAPERPRDNPPKLTIPSERGPRAAIAAGIVVVVALVIVLIVSGGGDSSTSSTTTGSDASEETASQTQSTPVTNSKETTKADLSSVDGSDATGTAIFGRVKNSLALQVEATGLEPSAKGQSYAIWLAQSPQRMLPLASTPVTKSGKIAAQFEVPVEVLAYLANETFEQMAITLVDDSRLGASLAKATKEGKSPVYTGTEVLRGSITGPIVGAQIRKEEAEREAE